MKRCSWCSDSLKYIEYHDKEWGLITDLSDRYLLEMLILESFQAGLSWECILNKREIQFCCTLHKLLFAVSHP